MEEPLSKELDFENEGRNSERCAENLQHLKYIYVPKVKWDLTSKVLSGGRGDDNDTLNSWASILFENIRHFFSEKWNRSVWFS